MNTNQVKLIRQYKNVSQTEFADWLGVSLSAISQVEAGHRYVSDNLAAKIAHKFDVNDPDFIEYVGRVKQTSNFLTNGCAHTIPR